MVSTQTNVADWLSKSNRFQAFPPCVKVLEEEEEVFEQQSLFSQTERPTLNASTCSELVLGVICWWTVRACLHLFRPGWDGWNGTRLLVVVRFIPSCLCPFSVSRQPGNRPEQKITQLTFAAGPRSSTRRQGCRHVGRECS